MDKPLVLTRSVLFLFILLLLIALSRCNHMVKVMEGKIMTLVFPYPCDSEKITIQRANGAPFYNSAEPGDLNLHENELNRFSVQASDCSLQVQINPVMKDDEATYICIAYKDGVIQGDFIRVRLNVDESPGRVSCVLSDDEVRNFFGTWVKLQCEVSVDSVHGEIICYQLDKKVPPFGPHGDILMKNVWVVPEHPVFCCLSISHQPTDRCECNEFAWDPSNTESVLHPCPLTTPRQDTTMKDQLGENSSPPDHPFPSTSTPLSSITTPNKVHSEKPNSLVHFDPWLWCFVLAPTALLVVSLVLICLKCKGKKDKSAETSEFISNVGDCASPKSEKDLIDLVDIQKKVSTSNTDPTKKDKCREKSECTIEVGDCASPESEKNSVLVDV